MNISACSIAHPVIDLPNITVRLAEDLRRRGIVSLEQLAALGSEESWRQLRAQGDSYDAHTLLALEGAITGTPWKELPSERRMQLIRMAIQHRDESQKDGQARLLEDIFN